MNVVLDPLFLRRPRIEYVSPPVCPIVFSASGVAFFDQCFNDLAFCSGQKINTNFLNFQEPPDGLAFNVYYSTQQSGQPFQLVNDGLAPYTAVFFTAGTYWFTVNTATGESGPFPPTSVPGAFYVRVLIPQTSDAISWNLYKDGEKIISQFTGTVVESSAEGWYQATKITVDGETPLSGCSALLLSGTVPVPPPPPPPPPPGPNWPTFVVTSQICNGCLGDLLNGVPVTTGGFTSGYTLAMTTEVIGGAPWEYVYNEAGFTDGTYSGGIAHSRLTIAASATGPGTVNSDNEIAIIINGVKVLDLHGLAMYASGNYDFDIPAGSSGIRFLAQGKAMASQTLIISATLSNIP